MVLTLITPPNPFGSRKKIEEHIQDLQKLKQTPEVQASIRQAERFLVQNDNWMKMKAEAQE